MNNTTAQYYDITLQEPHALFKNSFYNVGQSDLYNTYSYQINNQFLTLNYSVVFRPNEFIFNWTLLTTTSDFNTIGITAMSMTSVRYYGNYLTENVLNDTNSESFIITNVDTGYPVSLIFNLYYEDYISSPSQSYTNGYNDGYEEGYNVGYDYGHQVGYDNGYNVASTENGNFSGVFGLLGQAFSSTAGLYNTSVIGGLTIGGLITIPLAITCVVAIFKILRK